MDQHIRNNAHEDTIRDAIGKRHQHNTDKTRYSRYIIGEINLADVVHHHDTHQNQCCCCSLFRNSQEQRCEEQCHSKADGGSETGQSRASTYIHT